MKRSIEMYFQFVFELFIIFEVDKLVLIIACQNKFLNRDLYKFPVLSGHHKQYLMKTIKFQHVFESFFFLF